MGVKLNLPFSHDPCPPIAIVKTNTSHGDTFSVNIVRFVVMMMGSKSKLRILKTQGERLEQTGARFQKWGITIYSIYPMGVIMK